jgi:tripartite ATP-independent transporter DctM subunit
MILTIMITFVLTLAMGVPIAFTLGISSFTALMASDLPFRMISERMFNSVDSFPLLAIPLFMIAGEMMTSGGILKRLYAFANVLVGHIHGGLAHVATIASMILAGISGTAVADASAIASTMIPTLREKYGVDFAAAVVASGANIGPIIPPSAAMIVYAFMTGGAVSVAGLFLAGIVPGVLIGVGMMVWIYIVARTKGYATSKKQGLRELLIRTKDAFFILTMPFVVVGGIVGGIFTATEGAAVAVLYSLVIGLLITRELRLRDVWKSVINGTVVSAVVILLISLASSVTFLLTVEHLPNTLIEMATSISKDAMAFMLLTNGILILTGMVLESTTIYVMLVPIFAPVANAYGIDPLRFGFIFVLNVIIGMLTPPVGILLFLVAGISGISMERMTRAIIPFLLLQMGVLILCIFVPEVYMFIPRLFGY